MKRLLFSLAVVACLAFSEAQGALVDQGDGTVLDTDTNLMWLKDANYAHSELARPGRIDSIIANVGSIAGHSLTALDFDAATGQMSWWGAMGWAQDLTLAGFSDWRLPTATDIGDDGCNRSYNNTDCGYNVDPAAGELARLWYVSLGNTAWYDTNGHTTSCGFGVSAPYCFVNQGPFINPQYLVYTYGTLYAPIADHAWDFGTANGGQGASGFLTDLKFAWAVRSVDAELSVPEPATLALLGLGLASLGFSRRKQ